MNVRLSCAAGWALALTCALPVVARAESVSVVVAPQSTFATQVADRLRAGFGGDVGAPQVAISDTRAGCDAETTSTNTTITIDIGTDESVLLCVRSKAASNPRTLGPFAVLNATAAEQIATVIEASIEALQAPAPEALPSDTSDDPVVAEAATTTPDAEVGASPQEAPPPESRAPATDASTTNPADDFTNDAPAPPRFYGLTLDYALMLWNGELVSQGGYVGAQIGVLPSWLWFGAGLGVALPFDATSDGLGATFWALSLDARLGLRAALTDHFWLDFSLGPRLEALFVAPFVQTSDRTTEANAAESTQRISFTSVLEIDARLRVSDGLWLSAGVGAVFTQAGYVYGVVQADEHFTRVMSQAITRPFLQLGALLAL